MRETRSYHQRVFVKGGTDLNWASLTQLFTSAGKRKAIDDPAGSRDPKRIRGPEGTSTEENTFTEAKNNASRQLGSILRHTYEIRYSSEEPLEVTPINIPVEFTQRDGRSVCISGDYSTWLLSIPGVGESSDLYAACRTLKDANQVRLEGFLELVPGNTPLELSFQLVLQVSAVLPDLLDDPRPKLVRERVAIDLARRYLLRAAFLPEGSTSHEGMNISTFYSVLQPASSLPFEKVENVLQPEGLLATLLPFQRRSLAWLLEREGVGITLDGSTFVEASPRPFSLWTEVNEGNYTWWFNRLTGELIDEEPVLPEIHGGMLAEEPGLGKTVEIIALILCNPAPPEWNPTLVRWDASACTDAKAVKVCYLVYGYLIL